MPVRAPSQPNKTGGRTEFVDPIRIFPIHSTQDRAKLEELTESIRDHGWVGRPIAVLDAGYYLFALTGGNRTAAAIASHKSPFVEIFEVPKGFKVENYELYYYPSPADPNYRIKVSDLNQLPLQLEKAMADARLIDLVRQGSRPELTFWLADEPTKYRRRRSDGDSAAEETGIESRQELWADVGEMMELEANREFNGLQSRLEARTSMRHQASNEYDELLHRGNLGKLRGPETAKLTSPTMMQQHSGGSSRAASKQPKDMVAAFDRLFDKYVMARIDEAGQVLWAERNIAVPKMAAVEQPAAIQAALEDESLRGSLKDRMWNAFICRFGHNQTRTAMNPQYNAEEVPPEVIDDVMRDIEVNKIPKRQLSRSEETSDGLLNREIMRREVSEPAHKSEIEEPVTAALRAFRDALYVAPEPKKASVEDRMLSGFVFCDDLDGYQMHIGHEKEAADELPGDLFADESGDYTVGEQHLGTMTVNRLQEGRPRMQARSSELLSLAANSFIKASRKFNGYSIGDRSLNKIVPTEIDQQTGMILAGKILWNIVLMDHTSRRKRAFIMEMPVIAGKPSEEISLHTASGKVVAATQKALDAEIGVHRDARAVSRRHTNVPLAFVPEE